MASSKVMMNTSTTNQELPRQPTLCSSLSSLLADLQNHSNLNNNNINNTAQEDHSSMDDLLKNIDSPEPQAPYSACTPRETKSVDEVWKEIVAGDAQGSSGGEGITLEDFLTKAGAVREEDVRVPVGGGVGTYGVEGAAMGRGRGKRRAVEEPPVDRATQQKQRRMIKNRESAARSRERKQAYTVELESLVTQLEEEHARLVREEVEKKNERFKQLMENLIPVVEKRKPPRRLRRVNSWQW